MTDNRDEAIKTIKEILSKDPRLKSANVTVTFVDKKTGKKHKVVIGD